MTLCSDSSEFVLAGNKCPECVRQGDPHGAAGAPRSHLDGCPHEHVPDFASLYPPSTLPCLECANQQKWKKHYDEGIVYCPGAPRVHTCGR